MATERQIAADLANAKRSTGPVTDAGKQASSQNALPHGLLSHSCIILKSEKADRFDALLASLVEEFQPTTPNEYRLIETMAVARWRQVRNWTLQTATLELETANQDQTAGSPPVIAALAFRALADNSQALHLLQRYDTALDRPTPTPIIGAIPPQPAQSHASPAKNPGSLPPREKMRTS